MVTLRLLACRRWGVAVAARCAVWSNILPWRAEVPSLVTCPARSGLTSPGCAANQVTMLLTCMQSLANGCPTAMPGHAELQHCQLATHACSKSTTVLRWCQKAVIVKLQWVMSDPSYVNIASIRLDESTKSLTGTAAGLAQVATSVVV